MKGSKFTHLDIASSRPRRKAIAFFPTWRDGKLFYVLDQYNKDFNYMWNNIVENFGPWSQLLRSPYLRNVIFLWKLSLLTAQTSKSCQSKLTFNSGENLKSPLHNFFHQYSTFFSDWFFLDEKYLTRNLIFHQKSQIVNLKVYFPNYILISQ